jgi:hypothetical protein
MRLSLSLTNYSWPDGPAKLAAQLTQAVRTADDGGLDTVWVPDHFLQADPNLPTDAEMLEAYTTLGFLAATTRRIRLGTAVTGVTWTCSRAGGPGWGSAPATRVRRPPRWGCRHLRPPNGSSSWRRPSG